MLIIQISSSSFCIELSGQQYRITVLKSKLCRKPFLMCRSLLTFWGFCFYAVTISQWPLTGESCLWNAGKLSHTNVILPCEWTKYILLNYSQLFKLIV